MQQLIIVNPTSFEAIKHVGL